MTSVTISLPESLKALSDERESEVRLEALLVEGLASGGEDILLSPAFWKDLKAEAMDVAKKHRACER